MAVATKMTPSQGSEDPFEQWLAKRPKWLQTTAKRLLATRKFPKGEGLSDLADLCVAEAAAKEAAGFEKVEAGSIAHATPKSSFKILCLSDVRGVNAIKPSASLNFGKTNLVVIYGPNGSGKTGFARLIKDACGSRAKDEITGNVFEEAAPPGEATISVVEADKQEDLQWKAGVVVPQLRDVHVFDSRTATIYMMESNEASYEPMRMRFVSSLIRVCDEVSAEITTRKTLHAKALPVIPEKLIATEAAKWLRVISAKMTPATIEAACSFSQGQDDERIAVETALAQQDIDKRLGEIAKEKLALNRTEASSQTFRQGLSKEALGKITRARIDALAKRKAAADDAKAVFANAPLAGVGQASWMILWEAARSFSEEHVYHGIQFPNSADGVRCVLCQAELDDSARGRMLKFEAFVKSKLEDNAKAAEGLLSKLTKALPTVPTKDDWVVQFATLKVEDDKLEELRAALIAELNNASTTADVDAVNDVAWQAVDDALSSIRGKLDHEEKNLKALQQDGERKKLEAHVLELNGMKWLSEQRSAIGVEVARLANIEILEKAQALCDTKALTRKNTDLAKQELDSGYKERFAAELKRLGGGRLPIKPVSKQQGKGKTTFSITLQGAKSAVAAEKVLSEGELRIVALAAFLADITGSGNYTPFIFDDPISSLDQDFEGRVVARLIDLARTRQVIVLTHRLSLLTLLEDEVGKIRRQAELEQVPPSVELHVETLRRLGKSAGLTSKFSVRDAKPKQALNRLAGEMLIALKRLSDQGDVDGYEQSAKAVCSDFRILMERSVEAVMLNGVLIRFRRSLQTQGRIGALAKITSADCTFIDDLMTRYSVFEHSQSEEFAAAPPDFDALEGDVKALLAWVEEFEKRPVS